MGAKAYDLGFSDGIEGKKANNPYPDPLGVDGSLYRVGYKDGKARLPKKKKVVKEMKISNIDKLLDLFEKEDFITKEKFEKALKLGMTRDEISKFSKNPAALDRKIDSIQSKKWKEDDKKIRAKEREEDREARKNEPKAFSDEQMRKYCRRIAQDWEADNKHDAEISGEEEPYTIADVAPDLADSFFYPGGEPRAYAWVQKKLKQFKKWEVREMLADYFIP